MAVLILGSRGYLGSRFAEHFKDAKTSDARIKRALDVMVEIDKAGLKKEDFVINCIGGTGGEKTVDACENRREETYFSNVLVPKFIVQACKSRGIQMVQIGSGCIYDGDNNGRGFSEKDLPNFFGSFYSATKIMSEEVLSVFNNVLIARIRMPFDNRPHPRNLLDKLLKYARGKEPRIIDAPNSLTYVPFMLEAVEKLMQRRALGAYNVVNEGAITHPQILDIYQELSGEKLNYQRITAEQLDRITLARRSNCELNVSMLRTAIGPIPRAIDVVRKGIEEYLASKAQT